MSIESEKGTTCSYALNGAQCTQTDSLVGCASARCQKLFCVEHSVAFVHDCDG